jgi:hypothetical protein
MRAKSVVLGEIIFCALVTAQLTQTRPSIPVFSPSTITGIHQYRRSINKFDYMRVTGQNF